MEEEEQVEEEEQEEQEEASVAINESFTSHLVPLVKQIQVHVHLPHTLTT